jgi:hypothetical protein
MARRPLCSSKLARIDHAYVICVHDSYLRLIVYTHMYVSHFQLNLDEQTAEQLEGVGGAEQRRARAYVIDRCGPPT